MNLKKIIMRLWIEEDNRGSEKKSVSSSMGAKVNVVEQGSKKKRNSMVEVQVKDLMVLKGSRASAIIVANRNIVRRTVVSQKSKIPKHM